MKCEILKAPILHCIWSMVSLKSTEAVRSSNSALTHTAEWSTADRLYKLATTRGRVHCNHRETRMALEGWKKKEVKERPWYYKRRLLSYCKRLAGAFAFYRKKNQIYCLSILVAAVWSRHSSIYTLHFSFLPLTWSGFKDLSRHAQSTHPPFAFGIPVGLVKRSLMTRFRLVPSHSLLGLERMMKQERLSVS